MKLTRTSDLAIIITTHYIEEARQADFCGLMRNGILLVEDTPDSVLLTYKVKTLEDAFLQLCILQEDEKSDKFDTTDEDKKELIPQNFDENRSCIEWRPSTNRKNFDIRIITTIMYKIFIQLVRQPA
jgi:ABC-type multidrug transport system ATPase subunit